MQFSRGRKKDSFWFLTIYRVDNKLAKKSIKIPMTKNPRSQEFLFAYDLRTHIFVAYSLFKFSNRNILDRWQQILFRSQGCNVTTEGVIQKNFSDTSFLKLHFLT